MCVRSITRRFVTPILPLKSPLYLIPFIFASFPCFRCCDSSILRIFLFYHSSILGDGQLWKSPYYRWIPTSARTIWFLTKAWCDDPDEGIIDLWLSSRESGGSCSFIRRGVTPANIWLFWYDHASLRPIGVQIWTPHFKTCSIPKMPQE